MSPRSRGGRPKNAWTGSRRRLLVRLYTLTTLRMEEIEKVLETYEFHPKLRSIQKELGTLFPKDYATKFRNYRPSNDDSMRARVKLLHQVNQGRISKSRRYQGTLRHHRSMGSRSASPSKIFEGPASAFRYHSGPFNPRLCRYLSASSLNNSQAINSLRMMVDGSIIGNESNVLKEKGNFAREQELESSACEQHLPDPRNTHSCSSSCDQSRIMMEVSGIFQLATDAPLASNALSHATSRNSQIQLRNRSPSYTQHIQCLVEVQLDVYQLVGSGKSAGIQSLQHSSDDNRESPADSTQKSPVRTKRSFLKTIREVWSELVDEEQLLPPSSALPTFSTISLIDRPCCHLKCKGQDPCGLCGYTRNHTRARVGGMWSLLFDVGEINEQDHFGNTLLHYAAASGWDPDLIPYLNMLLGRLKELNFNLSDRDYHGRTPAHMYLSGFGRRFCPYHFFRERSDFLEKIIRMFVTDLNTMDNGGHSLRGQLAETIQCYKCNQPHELFAGYRARQAEEAEKHIQRVLGNLVALRSPINEAIDFQKSLCAETGQIESWFDFVKNGNRVSWIDICGNTPLAAVLKNKWLDEDEELGLKNIVQELLDIGANVNIRDRKGHTALAIAAIRGSRSCVQLLLDSGAVPNVRSYDGKGIITEASKRMVRAKQEGNDRCYSQILSCINLLIESGAKAEPTERDEWLRPDAPRLC